MKPQEYLQWVAEHYSTLKYPFDDFCIFCQRCLLDGEDTEKVAAELRWPVPTGITYVNRPIFIVTTKTDD